MIIEQNNLDGILLINKPKGITSRDVVNIASKKLNIKKIGHTGTLDPIATGVMVLCIGSATKLTELLTSSFKEYIATVKLGILTDTLDNTGNILKKEKVSFNEEKIKEVLSSFIGFYDQEVPIYSAVKVNGKKLYEYARENKEVSLPSRKVEIKEINLISPVENNDGFTTFKFKCLVSKGTYIRSLIRDIATRLNTVGIMTDLIRTKQGSFKIEDCISVDSISLTNLIKIEDALSIPKIELDSTIEKKVLNGAKINNIYNKDMILFTRNGESIAIYKKDNDILRSYKMLKGGIYDISDYGCRNGQ